MNETPLPPTPGKPDHTVAITAIIVTGVVLMTCIAGIAIPLVIAALNAR